LVSPSRSVLHIGGAKTASTTLQTGVLANSKDLHYFGEFGDAITTVEEESLVRSLLEADDSYFDEPAVRDMFLRHIALAGDGTFVFSSADILLACRPRQIAERLFNLMPSPPRVLLVVRNQITAIDSYYSGHGAWLKPAPHPYYRSFVSFNNWWNYQRTVPYNSPMRMFDYSTQLQEFIRLADSGMTTVVAFEDLVEGVHQAWRLLSECLGVDADEARRAFASRRDRNRVTTRHVVAGRVAGALLPWRATPDVRSIDGRLGDFLDRGERFNPSWSKAQIDWANKAFGHGNRALIDAFGLDLHRHGYPGLT